MDDTAVVRADAARAEAWVARWWADECGAGGRRLRTLLAPAEAAYRSAIWVRNLAYDAGVLRVTKLSVPVISVGNLSIGGSGKTPVAAWIVDELIRRGHRPALLHGGYAHDEPELHRRWHPEVLVIAQRDRIAAGRRAMAEGATVLVLDDGFQHRRLARNADLVLIAAEAWTPRPLLLPRGPWRERLGAARRATLLAVTRKVADVATARAVADAVSKRTGGMTVVGLALVPDGWRRASGRTGEPSGTAIAVAGVAQPALFVANARAVGAEVGELLAYPDHHAYTAEDGERIRRAARGRPILTTEKDWVKLAGLLDGHQVWLLVQRVEVDWGEDALFATLDVLET
jgi:tetraacyldisaccharide 4'-kinase